MPVSFAERTQAVYHRASNAGFDLCGIVSLADVERFDELAHFKEWLARGYAAEMKYLEDPRRSDPRLVLQGARSLIVVALNYNSPNPPSSSAGELANTAKNSDEPLRGWISRYAWGDDYHEILLKKLELIITGLRADFPEPFEARPYVDTGPFLERIFAKYAKLGWLGKNTLLIHPKLGSWLFLGVIITTLALEPTLAAEQEPVPDFCGTCTRCLEACPTQAFPEPYVLDARRCISYLTIELRGSVPEEFRPSLGNALIGCDICQDVCPWNRKSAFTTDAGFFPRKAASNGDSLFLPQLEWLAGISPEEFSSIFRKSAVKRAKWRGLVRNACVALGNSGLRSDKENYPGVISLLEKLAVGPDQVVAEHAGWALEMLRASGTGA